MSPVRDGLARLVGRTSRLAGLGGGTTLPGRALLRLDPDAMERLGGELEAGSVLVSATNGKTTSAAMLSRILGSAGYSVLANSAGSNMPWGIVTALLGERASIGVFEVDEAWLPEVARSLEPRAILLGNLFRDQLDRYGETEALAAAWDELAAEMPASTRFILNADDPMVAAVGSSTASEAFYFGIEDPAVGLESVPHASDARRCRKCDERLVFERTYLGHLGIYRCPGCGSSRPEPDLAASQVQVVGAERLEASLSTGDQEFRLDLPLPGIYNLYNALGAVATAIVLDIEPATATRSLAALPAVFGRAERVVVDGTDVGIFLIKNPVGANEVIRSLSLEHGPLDLWIALNDRIADGRDVSWIWDADFEQLSGRLRSVACSGTRAAEMALRLKYAGVPAEVISISNDLGESFDRAVSGAAGKLYALPTYTALLELKSHASRAAGQRQFWEVDDR